MEDEIKEFLGKKENKVLFLVLFLFVYFIIPKPFYACYMSECSFGILFPPTVLAEVHYYIVPYLYTLVTFMSLAQGNLISLNFLWSFSSLILHILIIYFCYKLTQIIVMRCFMKKTILSKKNKVLLVVGLLFIFFSILHVFLHIVDNFKEDMNYRTAVLQELTNKEDILFAAEKCNKIKNYIKGENCLENLRSRIGEITDIELCNMLYYHPGDQWACIRRILVEQGDPTLCEKYFSNKEYEYRDCITDMAIKNKNPEICNFYKDPDYWIKYEVTIKQNCIKKSTPDS